MYTQRRARTHNLVLLLALICCSSLLPAEHVVWVDFDMKDIPEPAMREVGYYEHFFNAQFIEQWKQSLDIPRWARAAVRRSKEAANVNALDEVPDSSWFTNRHSRKRMTIAELVQGPNRCIGIQEMDGYDAARLLVPGFRQFLANHLSMPFFAAIPNRDFLIAWAADCEQAFHQFAREKVARDFGERPYPLPADVFRADEDRVRPWAL